MYRSDRDHVENGNKEDVVKYLPSGYLGNPALPTWFVREPAFGEMQHFIEEEWQYRITHEQVQVLDPHDVPRIQRVVESAAQGNQEYEEIRKTEPFRFAFQFEDFVYENEHAEAAREQEREYDDFLEPGWVVSEKTDDRVNRSDERQPRSVKKCRGAPFGIPQRIDTVNIAMKYEAEVQIPVDDVSAGAESGEEGDQNCKNAQKPDDTGALFVLEEAIEGGPNFCEYLLHTAYLRRDFALEMRRPVQPAASSSVSIAKKPGTSVGYWKNLRHFL